MIFNSLKKNINLKKLLSRRFSKLSKEFKKNEFLENIKTLDPENSNKQTFFYYKVLNLEKLSDLEEIKTQFKAISK